MSKVITLRLSEEEYTKVLSAAKIEHRPISNFITARILENIDESFHVDPVEMAQIKLDKKLMEKLNAGHRDAKKMKGKLIG